MSYIEDDLGRDPADWEDDCDTCCHGVPFNEECDDCNEADSDED